MEKVFLAKKERRQQLAQLSYPEKVKIVIRLQEMAAPLLRSQGKKIRVWRMPDM